MTTCSVNFEGKRVNKKEEIPALWPLKVESNWRPVPEKAGTRDAGALREFWSEKLARSAVSGAGAGAAAAAAARSSLIMCNRNEMMDVRN